MDQESQVIVQPNDRDSLGVGRQLAVSSFGLTDKGRVRETNQDQFLIAELRKAMRVRQSSLPQPKTQYSDERGHLFLVADGMGGHRAGEQASALAVETIETFALNRFKWFFHLRGPEEHNVLTEFQAALRQADVWVHEEAAGKPDLRGMGTTLTMAYALGSDLYVAHVGDSRCYLLRQGTLHRLTQDHTLVGELVRRGQIPAKEAATHHLRHVITNAVGGYEPGIHVEVHKVELQPGDDVLLCTDGLTEMLADDRIGAVLQAEPDARKACERLVAEANEFGGKDNISVILARFAAPQAGTR
jgi:protein phosphatase